MSLTSYQAAPPCNKGEGKVLRAPKSVNAFPYLRRTLISALPTSESSSARVTAASESCLIRIRTDCTWVLGFRTFTVKMSPSLWSCAPTVSWTVPFMVTTPPIRATLIALLRRFSAISGDGIPVRSEDASLLVELRAHGELDRPIHGHDSAYPCHAYRALEEVFSDIG